MVQDGVEWFGAPTWPMDITAEASAECSAIRGLIRDLEADITKLQDDLTGAAPGQKAKIKAQLAKLRQRLSDENQLFQDLGCS
jgi:hypothetical protein